jgi:hypothetical protein
MSGSRQSGMGHLLRWYWLKPVVILFVLISSLLSLTGCDLPGLSEAGDTPAATPQTPPIPLSVGSGTPANIESSLALLREPGSEQITGTAVVVGSDGYLVTTLGTLTGNVEVVLTSGNTYRPVLVAVEPDLALALIKVPADRLVPVQFSTERLSVGDPVFAIGFDGAPDAIGQIGGEVTSVQASDDDASFRTRGPALLDTGIPYIGGFDGGALADHNGTFAGLLRMSEDESGSRVLQGVSNWYILGWFDHREERRQRLARDLDSWTSFDLVADWAMRIPDGWNESSSSRDDDHVRAEFLPADPDAALQIDIAVEPNQYGTDAETFVEDVFGDRSSAYLWGIDSHEGHPMVRMTIVQEGAVIDVAYILDPEHLIAVSLTSGYRPADDPIRADRARAIFDTLLTTIER